MNPNFSCKRGAIAGAMAMTLAWSALAQAQTPAVPSAALNRYEPAERGSEWFANDSLDFRGTFRPAFGITGDYAHAPYTLLNPDGSKNTAVIENTMYLHVGAAFVLFERLRIGLRRYASGSSASARSSRTVSSQCSSRDCAFSAHAPPGGVIGCPSRSTLVSSRLITRRRRSLRIFMSAAFAVTR
jgi:hypothetical protein